MERTLHSEISTWGGFVHIHSIHLAEVDTSREMLSEYELTRAAAYCMEADRLRYVAAHVFTRDVLSRYTHKEPADIEFGYSDFYNKPLLAGDGLHFNLSYRDEWALLAVSDKVLGLDIEKLIPIEDMEGFGENCFSEKERDFLNQTLYKTNFFRLWTLKEAYIKAIGKGLSYPLQEFSILIQNSKSTNQNIVLELPDGIEEKWGFTELEAPEGYAAAVCYLKQI
jgi:4'-phosphopantetheinyl transferase